VDDVHGWDFKYNRPLTKDNNIHGTHVAGIIAADPSKGSVQGMAPQATIMPLAFLGSDGSGDTSDAILALQYAINMKAKVANASWGGSDCSITLKNMIKSFGDNGGLFVVAAGNDGADIDQYPTYPASYVTDTVSNIITVAASTWLDDEAGFSNDGVNSVYLAAPGLDITSTVPISATYPDGIAALSGTSMATPFVTGAAALLWSDRPKATYQQIKDAILNSVDAGPFKVKTHGRLDVANAIQYIEAHVSQ
jgi:subtilisin family serine protease